MILPMKSLLSALLAFCWFSTFPVDAAEPVLWVEQKKAEFLPAREVDGDSFGMTVASPTGKRVKRTYRIYGADCPETGARGELLAQRIAEQGKHFGVKPEDIPALGKRATEYTLERLENGKPLVWTLGPMGEDAPGGSKDPKRRYALVEVTAPDGNRRMLHELLIENGLARAHGQAAPWPEKSARRLGEKKAKERFMKDLERMERKAKNDRLGIWKGP